MENIYGLYWGSGIKETQLHIVKTSKRRFHFRNTHFPLKSVTLISIWFCFLPCCVWISEQKLESIHLVAVGLIHRKITSWQSSVFKDTTHASERWMGSLCRRDGARSCCPSYGLGTASQRWEEISDTSDASQANAHTATAADNSPP